MYMHYCPLCDRFWHTKERPPKVTTWYGRPGYGGWRVCDDCRRAASEE